MKKEQNPIVHRRRKGDRRLWVTFLISSLQSTARPTLVALAFVSIVHATMWFQTQN